MAALPGALPPAGWACSKNGASANGELQSKDGYAFFKHSQSLEAEDVLRMKVRGGIAIVGIAAEGYDVERSWETKKGTAWVYLLDGTSFILSGISEDDCERGHPSLLKDHIPETLPYDVALRVTKDYNIPQIRFNKDGKWHDFAPEFSNAGLKAGPWFPYVLLGEGDRLGDICVDRVGS